MLVAKVNVANSSLLGGGIEEQYIKALEYNY